MENTRYLHNVAIIQKLKQLVEEYPEQRFTQLLWNAGIINSGGNKVIDNFYEESKETWRNMTKNNFCFPQNGSDENL